MKDVTPKLNANPHTDNMYILNELKQLTELIEYLGAVDNFHSITLIVYYYNQSDKTTGSCGLLQIRLNDLKDYQLHINEAPE